MENKVNYKKRYIALNSVGCFLDKVSGYTFAMLDNVDSPYGDSPNEEDDGNYDLSVHLDDCSDEWFDSLSKEDIKSINDFYKFDYITDKDKLKVAVNREKHGDIIFFYEGIITEKQAFKLQLEYGKHPHGYGLFSFKVVDGISSWNCMNCCD